MLAQRIAARWASSQKKGKMDSKNRLIHHEKFFRLNNLIPLLLLVIAWVIVFFIGSENLLSILVFTGIMLIIFMVTSRRNSTYFIYEDRIEFFNSFSNRLDQIINLEQIDQIRYEDEFTNSNGYFWSDFMIIYPKKGVAIKNLKKNRIHLTVTGLNRKSNILKILKFFQSKNLEVVIKTESKKIKRETGLENWDKV